MSVLTIARGPWRWFLLGCGASAITMPWGRIYILAEWRADVPTLVHELVHLDQIRRDGPVWFSARYLWWLVRYGYQRNPYEIEAYAVEAHAEKETL